MAVLHRSKRLKKELSLFNVYAFATGATLSSGFFLLPGLAAAQAGPAVTVSYLIAAVLLVPAVFSMAELSTAMPRAGGIYYYLDRGMGPLLGTVGGLGTWLALILKTAFALIGMGAYLRLFFPEFPILPLATALAIVFGGLNLLGAKKSGRFQVFLVMGLLALLFGFCGQGLTRLNPNHFADYFGHGLDAIYATAGLVYISYVGLTNIASVSEEVKNPERNLPLGMMLALVTAILIYALGTVVMVGVLSPTMFHNDLTPVASVAKRLWGKWGAVVMTVGAVLAFFSVSNAAILSASRYPLAMSRDHLLPRVFRFLTKRRTPWVAIFTTVALVVLCLVAFEPTKIAKLASAFQLLLFSLTCLAVIVMRESHLDSYDPGYRSPFYPWMQLFGMGAPLFLIAEMGAAPVLFTLGLITAGTVWYYLYARKHVSRKGAVFHIFARLGERRDRGLDRELRSILQEKGLRDEDPFDVVVARAGFIDLDDAAEFEQVVQEAAEHFARRLGIPREQLAEGFLQGTRVGATPVSHGVALPHLRLPKLEHPELILVRAKQGVKVEVDDEFFSDHSADEPVYAFFFLVSSEENPGQHLRLLAELAERAGDDGFVDRWLMAADEHDVKELLHRDRHFLSFELNQHPPTRALIGKAVCELDLPEDSLVAIVHRDGQVLIPRGRTVLKEGDRLTIIAEPETITKLKATYTEGS